MKILAATDFSTRSQRAVRRAGLLARESGAELALTHVVDDDRPSGMVQLERKEAERMLAEQIGTIPQLQGVACHPLVVEGDPFEGILRAAAASGADLLVMGAHRKHLLRDVFVGTTVERVIRTGPRPVLMVNAEADQPYRVAFAAVNRSKHSVNAIRVAQALGWTGHVQLILIHAFSAIAKGKMKVVGISQTEIDEHVAAERRRVTGELTKFLSSSKIDAARGLLRVEEGEPFDVISRAVHEGKPDVLLIGTRGRSGLLKLLLGSVTEQVLRRLDVDILAVPPQR
jgi:nucleotide-binding universal stress UspA family protein